MMPQTHFREHKESFRGVLYNFEDQVIVRRLLEDLVPANVKAAVVEAFNADVDRYNAIVKREIEEGTI